MSLMPRDKSWSLDDLTHKNLGVGQPRFQDIGT